MTRIGEILAEWIATLDKPRERHPIRRSGERDQIAWMVRLSIYLRDGEICRICKSKLDPELDHLLPWSAGGGDHSANLRTLCHRCNTRRSNFKDNAEDRLPTPTTWWCWHCWRHPEIEVDDPDLCDWNEPRSRFRGVWKDGTDLTRARFVTEPETHVYCASCWTYSLSDVYFSESMQPALVDLCAPKPATGLAACREGLRGEERG